MKRFCQLMILVIILIISGKLNAQNTGPVAPEAMSFEPVDATDMVDLLSGDFSYVLPLFEVPGPEGGYPIGLSYHAGIAVDQEASWVGLGWNINPGAINRDVKGYPDDYKDKVVSSVFKDAGGTKIFNNVSIGIPFGNLSFGVNLSWGTNRSLRGDFFMQNNGPVQVDDDGVSLSAGNGIGISINNNSGVSMTAGNSIASYSIGISMSSGDASGKLSVAGGMFSSTKTSAGAYKTKTNSIVIPIGIFSYRRSKIKWWANEHRSTYISGPLYLETAREALDDPAYQSRSRSMDINEYSTNEYNAVVDTDWGNCWSEPNFDQYSVAAQGLSGSMIPELNQSGTLVKNSSTFDDGTGTKEVYYINDGRNFESDLNRINFSFEGSLSTYLNISDVSFKNPFGDPVSSGSGGVRSYNSDYFNADRNLRIQGKHVEYFTNKQIEDQNTACVTRGFIETDALLNQRNNGILFDPDGIGAYSITTEDGKTYHYSLPVYQFESIMTDKSGDDKQLSEQRMFEKYATSWLLTAITGPDYVDNGDNLLNDGDYGYWVKFEYGKWSDGYIWRTPYSGYKAYKTPDDKARNTFTWGRKQIYYLNSISTPTHIAYFIKDIRDDGESAPIQVNDTYTESQDMRTYVADLGNYTLCDGGNHSLSSSVKYKFNKEQEVKVNITDRQKVCKLDRIVLVAKSNPKLSNENVTNLVANPAKELTGNYVFTTYLKNVSGGTSTVPCIKNSVSRTFSINLQNNILDVNDNLNNIDSKAIKVIKMNYDYSNVTGIPLAVNSGAKLTLKSVEILGKGGRKVLPPYIFEYYQQPAQIADKWGFCSTYPQNWSLSKITDPVGSSIKISYESDTYKQEAFARYLEKVYALGVHKDNDPRYIWIKVADPVSILAKDAGVRVHLELFDDKGVIFNKLDFAGLPYSKGTGTDEGYIRVRVDENNYDWETVIDKICWTKLPESYVEFVIPSPTGPFTGGGLRVSELSISDQTSSKKDVYNYNDPATGTTSGITSYSPSYDPLTTKLDNKYIPFANNIPGPSVMYGFVTIDKYDFSSNLTQKTIHEFKVMKSFYSDMGACDEFNVQRFKENYASASTHSGTYVDAGPVNTIKTNITDISSMWGTIKSTTNFNGLNQLVNKTVYHYKTTNQMAEMKLQNLYIVKKIIRDKELQTNKYNKLWNVAVSSKEKYPAVLDYIENFSSNGKSTTYYEEYDKITGYPKITRNEEQNGDIVRTTVNYAYTQTAYKGSATSYGMDSKGLIATNKNMLSQEAGKTIEKKINGVYSPISSTAQTWNKNWNYYEFNDGFSDSQAPTDEQKMVWRKQADFIWKGALNSNGTYSNYLAYDFDKTLSENALNGWVKSQEITRYNHYSFPLEVSDVNNNYSTTETSLIYSRPILNATGANFNEARFCGFEEMLTGSTVYGLDGGFEADKSPASFSVKASGDNSILAHSGNYYGQIGSGGGIRLILETGSKGLQISRKYKFNVWVHKNSKDNITLKIEKYVNAAWVSESKTLSQLTPVTMGDWILLNMPFEIKKDVSEVKLVVLSSSTANIDDIRVQPIDAKVSSSSYDDAGNVTAILDNNNFAAKFEYDAAGRLISSFKETPQGFKKVSSNKYNYKRSYYYVDFTMSANTIKPGDAVTFIATDAGASNASDYNWDFGDGQSAQGKVVTHTFSGYGSATLTVNLTVKDPDNKTISVSKYLRKIDNANLVITSPKSYGTYYREETINIQWNGYSGPVDIMIGIPGSVPGGPNSPTVISNSVTGGYSWQIPSYMALGAYVITVQASDGSKSASVQINIPEKGY